MVVSLVRTRRTLRLGEAQEFTNALRERNLLWVGEDDWGPFGVGRYTHGLLPWKTLAGAPSEKEPDHDPLLEWFGLRSSESATHFCDLGSVPAAFRTRSLNYSQPLVLLVDRAVIKHQMTAWNVRSRAHRVVVVDDDNGAVDVSWDAIVEWCRAPADDEAAHVQQISVWDLRGNAPDNDSALTAAATAAGISCVHHDRLGPRLSHARILRTDLNSSFNVSVSVWSHARNGPHACRATRWQRDCTGGLQDRCSRRNCQLASGSGPATRRTLTRQSPVLGPSQMGHGRSAEAEPPDSTRIRRRGQCRGLSLTVPLHRKSDVFHRLFGPDNVVVGQSDVGLFQTRAAEMLSTAGSATMTQPGLAAALTSWRHTRQVCL